MQVFTVDEVPDLTDVFMAGVQPSLETQGQIKGARESLNGWKNIYGTKKTKERREELFSPFFTFLRAKFFRPFRLSLAPTLCPWVSEDGYIAKLNILIQH